MSKLDLSRKIIANFMNIDLKNIRSLNLMNFFFFQKEILKMFLCLISLMFLQLENTLFVKFHVNNKKMNSFSMNDSKYTDI